jgi:hypothetical protein
MSGKNIDFGSFTDLHVASSPDYEERCFLYRLPACMCARALADPERFHAFYSYLVFTSLSILGSCPMNLSIPI